MNLENIELRNFVELNDDEKLEVLGWRNDKNIRKWMYNQKVISKEEHLAFIDKLQIDSSNKYFLVKSDNVAIGVIYFNNILRGSSLEMGLYSSPYVKGVGTILLTEIIKYSFNKQNVKKIIAEVFSDNSKASLQYERNGFEINNIKERNGKQILIMELNHENR